MAIRIACDLDGTVAHMEKALQHEAERLFGPQVDLRARGHVVAEPDRGAGRLKSAPTSDAVEPALPKKPLTDAQMRLLWAHVKRIDNFWTTLDEIEPGAVAQLADLASAHRWEVLFVTQRPDTAGETAQRQSQRWLEAHGFRYPSVYVMQGSRGKLADALALHAVLDDRPENCLDVRTDSRARPLLVWRDPPEAVPAATISLGIDVVFSLAEALAALTEMTRRAVRPRSLMARLRHAISAT